MSEIASPALVSAPSRSVFLSFEGLLYAGIGAVVIALVAAVFEYGYPLLITLAVSGAFLGLAMIVGLTLIDLMRGTRRAAKR